MRRLVLVLVAAWMAQSAMGCAHGRGARAAGQIAAGLAVAAAAQAITTAAQAAPEKGGDRAQMTDEERRLERERKDEELVREANVGLRAAKRRAAAQPAAFPSL